MSSENEGMPQGGRKSCFIGTGRSGQTRIRISMPPLTTDHSGTDHSGEAPPMTYGRSAAVGCRIGMAMPASGSTSARRCTEFSESALRQCGSMGTGELSCDTEISRIQYSLERMVTPPARARKS